ncbi:amidase family protein, partial [Alphaproteobacteria bacterium]|nr:amidase family protein [Alphaproteobacteria bacterium]
RGLLAQLMSVQGVIAREVRDVRLAMKSLIAYDAQDVWQVPMPFYGPKPEGKIKVAFTKNTFDFDLDPAIAAALDHARDCLVDAGYEVVEVEPPLINEIAEVGGKCLFGEAKVLMLDDIRKYGSATINKIFDSYFEYFEPYEGKDLLLGMAKRSYYIRQWQLFMQDYPLVLTPLLPMQTPVWNLDETEGAREALGTGIYSFSMNYMGLPAGNIPAAYNDGLPIAVQIVAPRFREDMILDACEAIEQRTGVMAEKLFERG